MREERWRSDGRHISTRGSLIRMRTGVGRVGEYTLGILGVGSVLERVRVIVGGV